MTNREKQKIKTRKKIFLAARDLFEKNGYHNTKIEDIVSACEVAKGTFYTHFKSKSDILVEEFKIIDDDYMDFYENQLVASPSEDMLSFLIHVLETVQNKLGKERTRIIYSHYLEENYNTYIINSERALYKIIYELLDKAFQGTSKTTSNLEEILGLITSLIRGSIYDWCADKNNNDLVKSGGYKFKILLDSLLPKE